MHSIAHITATDMLVLFLLCSVICSLCSISGACMLLLLCYVADKYQTEYQALATGASDESDYLPCMSTVPEMAPASEAPPGRSTSVVSASSGFSRYHTTVTKPLYLVVVYRPYHTGTVNF